MNCVDLHVHSNKSDGSFTPAEVVGLAAQKGLSAFALTDHDTTAGVKEAVAAGLQRGIEVIPGIEFSTEYYGKDIHIVGLFIDEDAPAFQSQIHRFVEARVERNEKMCARLAADGIDISYAKLVEAFPESVITRGHYSICLITATSKAFPKPSTAIWATTPNILSPVKKSRPRRRFPSFWT